MVYGYIRVSTDKQSLENQKFELSNFAQKRQWTIFKWVEEIISGTKKIEERQLGTLLSQMAKGDTLLVSELSRLGRNLLQIMSILNFCMEKEICVFTAKEGYELGNNINSKVLAFAFSLSAEIERTLISQRTKEALARRRSEGIVLGRPLGRKSSVLKLTDRAEEFLFLRSKKLSKSEIGRRLGVHRTTVSNFIKASKTMETF
jgi:DNA invertase Pin-like site-specific DNA recombinase